MDIRSRIVLALCLSGAAASPSLAHRVYFDINTDGDPWTINPISTESSAVVDVIVEVQDAPLSGHYELWFQTGSCGGTPEDPFRVCEVGIDLPQGATEWCVGDIHEFCFWSGMGVGDSCEPGFIEGWIGPAPLPVGRHVVGSLYAYLLCGSWPSEFRAVGGQGLDGVSTNEVVLGMSPSDVPENPDPPPSSWGIIKTRYAR
jgi:hypothetical protein